MIYSLRDGRCLGLDYRFNKQQYMLCRQYVESHFETSFLYMQCSRPVNVQKIPFKQFLLQCDVMVTLKAIVFLLKSL